MRPTLPLVVLATLALAGCAAPAPADDGLSVVASTSVYGDLAASVVGDLGTVTSLIDGAGDPHSFEASARDQLAIAGADLVIANGGGYDPFMEALLDASGSSAPEIVAVDVSGLPDVASNEHVWYSFEAVSAIVGAIAEQLSALQPADADAFQSNADALVDQVDALAARASALALTGGAAVTEPVPVYLLDAVGLHNVTPVEFTEAIEEGSDVPPLALQDTIALFDDGAARVLAYNSQTASPETERVREAATAAGIPVVDFTETLPDGAGYVSWMTANLDALETALLP